MPLMVGEASSALAQCSPLRCPFTRNRPVSRELTSEQGDRFRSLRSPDLRPDFRCWRNAISIRECVMDTLPAPRPCARGNPGGRQCWNVGSPRGEASGRRLITSNESKGSKAGGRGGKGASLTVCSWNINNRVGQTTFRIEAAAAAMETDADVLVFSEFFPKTLLGVFQHFLTAGGWRHQEISDMGAVRANRLLVASRFPVVVKSLPPSTVDDHLSANALRVDIGALRLLAIRVPAYKGGREHRNAWTWLAGIAEEMQRTGGPAIVVGDLNTSMSATGARRVDAFHQLLENGWTRTQPEGVGSFAREGAWYEIDHVLTTKTCRISDARYVVTTPSYELAGTPSSLSDHAALVFRATTLP